MALAEGVDLGTEEEILENLVADFGGEGEECRVHG